jgi:hypothetical protein
MNHRDPITDYGRWLSGIKEWLEKKQSEEPTYPGFPPTETTKIFTAETAQHPPKITILAPAAFSTVAAQDIKVEVDAQGENGVDRVVFYLDERNLPSSVQRKPPYTGKVHLSKSTKAGTHIITAKLFDKIGYVAEAKVEFQYEK